MFLSPHKANLGLGAKVRVEFRCAKLRAPSIAESFDPFGPRKARTPRVLGLAEFDLFLNFDKVIANCRKFPIIHCRGASGFAWRSGQASCWEDSTIATGTVKWFNNAKGYGFILPSDGGGDLFAHYTAIEMEGYKTLKAGQQVVFDVEEGPKGHHAINIRAESDDDL